MWICPKCKQTLIQKNKQYQCSQNHHYDISKSGYVNLILNHSENQGDNKQMVQARYEFLQLGYYQFLQEALIDIIELMPNEVILDMGCGEGYYTNAFAKRFKNVYGIDLSKYAIIKASKSKQAHYAIASCNDVCMAESSCDVITNIFSHRNLSEVYRLLKLGGTYIEVIPDENHLIELKQVLYQNVYRNEENVVDTTLTKVDQLIIQNRVRLDQKALNQLFAMTPYYYRTSEQDKQKLNEIEHLVTTFSFKINIYVKEE